jgi:hypothetical protein
MPHLRAQTASTRHKVGRKIALYSCARFYSQLVSVGWDRWEQCICSIEYIGIIAVLLLFYIVQDEIQVAF